MDPQAIWSLFMDTGAPEAYVMYRKAKEQYVSEHPGLSDQDHKI